MGASQTREKPTCDCMAELALAQAKWDASKASILARVDAAAAAFFRDYCVVDAEAFGAYDAVIRAFELHMRRSEDFAAARRAQGIHAPFERALRAAGGTVHPGRLTVSGVSLARWPVAADGLNNKQ